MWADYTDVLQKKKSFDSRGKNTKKKLDDSRITEHIKSFPTYQSHYTRKNNPNRRYLNENLTIAKMYELREISKRKYRTIKKKFYYHIFNTKFNLSFKPPAKDTCRFCDEFKMKISLETDKTKKKRILTHEKALHQAKTEKARSSLKNDQQIASDLVYVATFDLQKALPFPNLTTSIA